MRSRERAEREHDVILHFLFNRPKRSLSMKTINPMAFNYIILKKQLPKSIGFKKKASEKYGAHSLNFWISS